MKRSRDTSGAQTATKLRKVSINESTETQAPNVRALLSPRKASEARERLEQAATSPVSGPAPTLLDMIGAASPSRERRKSIAGRRNSIARRMSLGRNNSRAALESYTQTVELLAKNKINQKNSWQLRLIDYMDALLSATATAEIGSFDPDENGRIEMDSVANGRKAPSDPSRPRLYNFQVASHTLDASVKIWSNRVDSVHTDTYKVLGELNRTGGSEAPSKSHSHSDDADDDDDQSHSASSSLEETETRGKKKAASKVLNAQQTIETNASNMNTKIVSEIATDPVFQKMTGTIDENGAKYLLLNQMGVCVGGNIAFDSSEVHAKETTDSEEISVDQLQSILGSDDWKSFSICPDFENFRFDDSSSSSSSQSSKAKTGETPSTPALAHLPGFEVGEEDSESSMLDTSSASMMMLNRYEEILMKASTNNLLPAQQQHHLLSAASLDEKETMLLADLGEDDGLQIAYSGGDILDDEGDYGVEDRGEMLVQTAAYERAQMNGGAVTLLNKANSIGSQQALSRGSSLSEVSTSDFGQMLFASTSLGAPDEIDASSDYSYFNTRVAFNWAGPQHWKFGLSAKSASTRAGEKGDGDETQTKTRGKRSEFMIDFGKTLDPSLFELILQQPKNPNSTMLADHNRQLSGADKNSDSASPSSYTPPAHANLLPPDANYDLTSVCKLYLMPNVRMMFAGNAANKILLSDPSSLSVPGPSDAGPLLSETPMFQTNGASVFNTSSNQLNSSGMWDLGMVPEIANASFLNSSMHYGGSNDEGADGADDEDQYGFTNAEILHSEPIDDLLVAAPMQVSRLTINYARRAKRVDVKKLKLNIWRDLCTRSGEPSRIKDMEKAVSESMEDKKTFQEVLDQLPSNSSDKELEDISVPYCFICLLHLANEKGLTIENTDSGDLLIHQN